MPGEALQTTVDIPFTTQADMQTASVQSPTTNEMYGINGLLENAYQAFPYLSANNTIVATPVSVQVKITDAKGGVYISNPSPITPSSAGTWMFSTYENIIFSEPAFGEPGQLDTDINVTYSNGIVVAAPTFHYFSGASTANVISVTVKSQPLIRPW